MDFTFSDDQEQLRRVVRDFGRAHAPGRRGSFDRDAWQAVAAELGTTGIGIAEERGGAGGDFVDAAVVIEEAGRTLLALPLTTTLVAGAVLDRCGADASSVASGETIAVLAQAQVEPDAGAGRVTGLADHVLDGDLADLALLATDDALWLVAPTGVEPQPALDLTRQQATLRFDAAPATRIGGPDEAAAAVDLLRVALAVEAVGAARECLDLVVSHLLTREQFGRPIGAFQALQHRAADLVVRLESAASTAYYAAWAAAEAPAELPIVAPLAKAVCCDAAWQIAADMIQLHGGIGFTWEHDAHLYFKRLTTSRLLLGDATAQRRLVASRAPIGSEPAGR